MKIEGSLQEIKDFEQLVKPISEFIKKNYDPHTTIIITDEFAKIVRDYIGTPIKID